MANEDPTHRESRESVIDAVKTPLGFFTLGLLVFEAALLAIIVNTSSAERAALLWGNLILIFLTLVLVAVLAYFRPSLFGVDQKQDDSKSQDITMMRNSFRYDLFVSAPMTSLSEEEYRKVNAKVIEVVKKMEASQRFEKVYYAGRSITKLAQADPSSISAKRDLEALRTSRHYMLIYPDKVVSSVLVEAGYALALQTPSFYLVHKRDDLPYMLREVPDSHQNIHIFTYTDQPDLLLKIEKYIFPIDH